MRTSSLRTSFLASVVLGAMFALAAPGKPLPKTDANVRRDAQAAILREIKHFAPARRGDVDGLAKFNAAMLPDSAVDLAPYASAGFDPFAADDVRRREMRAKFPLRIKVWEIAKKLDEHMQITMDETLQVGVDPPDAKVKRRFLDKQKDPALAVLELEELLEDARTLLETRDEEKSKRWQAHFDLARARLTARLVYIDGYCHLLGQVRSDRLPEFDPEKHVGWRVEATPGVQMTDTRVRALARDTMKTWNHIIAAYPGTPWAAIAERERDRPQGLRWVPILRVNIENP